MSKFSHVRNRVMLIFLFCMISLVASSKWRRKQQQKLDRLRKQAASKRHQANEAKARSKRMRERAKALGRYNRAEAQRRPSRASPGKVTKGFNNFWNSKTQPTPRTSKTTGTQSFNACYTPTKMLRDNMPRIRKVSYDGSVPVEDVVVENQDFADDVADMDERLYDAYGAEIDESDLEDEYKRLNELIRLEDKTVPPPTNTVGAASAGPVKKTQQEELDALSAFMNGNGPPVDTPMSPKERKEFDELRGMFGEPAPKAAPANAYPYVNPLAKKVYPTAPVYQPAPSYGVYQINGAGHA